MISLRPVTSRVVARLFRTSVASSASQTLELSPRVQCSVDEPLMLADAPARIRRHHLDSDPALNIERLTRTLVEQGPTRMHLLRDIIIADGAVMARNFFERLAPVKRRVLALGEPEHIEEAVLCTTYFTEKYFGHWLREGLALEQLATDQGLMPLVLDRPPWTHESSYRRIVSMHPRRARLARCDRLWIVEESRYNSHFAERYHRVRDRLRVAVGAAPSANLRVLLGRGRTAKTRILANEDEVRRALGEHGFIALEPESMDAADLASILAAARMVVAPEGSALAHATIAMPRGSGLLTILGAQHFNMNYKAICDTLDFRFGFTIADAVGRDQFRQPIDPLLRTIDLIESAVERSREKKPGGSRSPALGSETFRPVATSAA
jgi:Glycosyltransferase 61